MLKNAAAIISIVILFFACHKNAGNSDQESLEKAKSAIRNAFAHGDAHAVASSTASSKCH